MVDLSGERGVPVSDREADEPQPARWSVVQQDMARIDTISWLLHFLVALIIVSLFVMFLAATSILTNGFVVWWIISTIFLKYLLLIVSNGPFWISLVLFEFFRKRGDDLFSKISDDMQALLHTGPLYADNPHAQEQRDKVRTTLRRFSRAAELPLVPGRHGVTVYAMVGLFITFSTLLVMSSWK